MSQSLGHDRTDTGTGVTHDPLCTWRQAEEADAGDPRRWLAGGLAVCDCYKIAEVREDTIAKCIAAVADMHQDGCGLYYGLINSCDCGIESAMRALQEKP